MSKYYSAEFEDIKNCIIGPCWYMMEITDIIKIKFLTIHRPYPQYQETKLQLFISQCIKNRGYIDFFSNDIKSNKQTNFHIP